jgi:fibro-slime domain-containing protein
MFSRHPLLTLVSLTGITAILACSAQGDQSATGVDDDGNNGGTGGIPTNGGTGAGGTGGAVIPQGGASSGAAGTGAQPGTLCQGTGARLKAVLRDFQPTAVAPFLAHPDFEPHLMKPSASNFYNMVELGIVQRTISDEVNRKPMYAGPMTGTNTTQGSAYFPSWFTDTMNVNLSIDYYLDFVEQSPGSPIYVFDRMPFLPVDDPSPANPNSCPQNALQPNGKCLLGNSTNYMTHNYALTLEFHTKFKYTPGMRFVFAGDDDVWVFVNGQLAIDLGGIHQRTEATLNLDNAGLTVGAEYILDFFWAERHVTASNFRVETSLDFINCQIDVPK